METSTAVILLGVVQIFTLVLCSYLGWVLIKQKRVLRSLAIAGEEGSHQGQTDTRSQGGDLAQGNREGVQQAEFKAALQRVNSQRVEAPEKYRYLASMADKGMKSEDLAHGFGISELQAEQLITLSRMASGSRN